jgi:hypothetical protein
MPRASVRGNGGRIRLQQGSEAIGLVLRCIRLEGRKGKERATQEKKERHSGMRLTSCTYLSHAKVRAPCYYCFQNHCAAMDSSGASPPIPVHLPDPRAGKLTLSSRHARACVQETEFGNFDCHTQRRYFLSSLRSLFRADRPSGFHCVSVWCRYAYVSLCILAGIHSVFRPLSICTSRDSPLPPIPRFVFCSFQFVFLQPASLTFDCACDSTERLHPVRHFGRLQRLGDRYSCRLGTVLARRIPHPRNRVRRSWRRCSKTRCGVCVCSFLFSPLLSL